MALHERRLILDRGFDGALKTVLVAFVHEGFVINPTAAGDLHRPCDAKARRRYALLDAALAAPTGCSSCACRISMFELAGACTLVTIENAGSDDPPTSTSERQIAERVHDVIRVLLRTSTLNAA